MTQFQGIQQAIAVVAIICAILSFFVYLVFSYRAVKSETAKKVEESVREAVGPVREMLLPSAKDVAEILKALGSLAESLAKAGPALWSMLGSALFLLIAALAIGVFSGSPPVKPDAGASNRAATENQTVPEDDENLPVKNSATGS